MIINFIRHGVTTANDELRVAGINDVDLCKRGEEELKRFKIEGIYSTKVEHCFLSALKRTKQTKDIIYPDLPFSVHPILNEISFGVYEDTLPREHLDNREYMDWLRDTSGKSVPEGGEPYPDFRKRIVRGIETVFSLAKQSGFSEIAIIGHGGFFGEAMELYFSDPRKREERVISNGCGFRAEAKMQDNRVVLEKLEDVGLILSTDPFMEEIMSLC